MLSLLFPHPSKFVKLGYLSCLLRPSVFESNPRSCHIGICSQNWRIFTVPLIPALHCILMQIVCKQTDKNTSSCTFRVAFIAKTDMPQQFTVQMYAKSVFCTKPVYCTSAHKGWTVKDISTLMMKGMYMDRTLQRNGEYFKEGGGHLHFLSCFFAAKK